MTWGWRLLAAALLLGFFLAYRSILHAIADAGHLEVIAILILLTFAIVLLVDGRRARRG